MSVLEIKNLTHRYDDKFIFNEASLTVNNGEHIGVVGLNGAGKSTFINIIADKLTYDEGEVQWLPGLRKGYLDQHATLDGEQTVMDYLTGAFDYLYQMNDRLEQLYSSMGDLDGDQLDRAIKKSSRLQETLENEGFYDLEAKVKKVANGLGVNNFGYDTKVGRLSGGERAKLMLSKLLLSELDVMLLDEPTNFLDIEHVDWLIKYLNGFKKTFIVISHDTKFLNAVANFIVNVENGYIKKYSGNYDKFLVMHEMNAKQYEEEYNRQQEQIKKLQTYIDKNSARASTAGMANARKKQLAKIEVMQKPVVAYDAQFNFPVVELNTKDLLTVTNLEIGYDHPLLPPLNIHMRSGTKLWVRGTNGIGKSTLIKTLMRKIPRISGFFTFHNAVKIAYLEQDLEFAQSSESASAYYSRFFPRANPKEIRSELAKVGLKGELATKPLKNMSGGEQIRAKLAVLCKTPSNLLILDEPTNHLDVKAKKALKEALIAYEGALILVSHEEDFVQDICNEITLLRD
ncbi:MAG: ABC-F family ATP-binding cassette domain-containing protein [Clostridia bacterium]|nr:ABC-F family ATP-binding cassette domain-containing protein [Clostridia bacterium]